MNTNNYKNTEGIKNYAKLKSELTLSKVDQAIQILIKNKEKINFNSVSITAGVSKSYLYNHLDIRERIDKLREQQKRLPSPKQVKYEITDTNKDILLAARNKRIKQLEDENKRLKKELMHLRGKIYEG
ncbi:DUF6262 family protein [Bacillus sp. IBL03825]|uniref:DUF6262 family protein n=1 Tax=Bacillus sp. IBL03825 TaxID=2953580 RepID=UPI002157744D|nr:DUF6262 family protein [Bacillus sp. IBL03825]MCR6847335.1 DUF6262 family protein [Bacillus sp. IBL03825]MCR6850284.1 DUF6262 family protein [Bacillus sp. IBL03825]